MSRAILISPKYSQENCKKKVDEEIKGVEDFSQKFQKMYDDLYNEHYQYQTQYEIDTDNGRHEENQEKYNTLIREMLL